MAKNNCEQSKQLIQTITTGHKANTGEPPGEELSTQNLVLEDSCTQNGARGCELPQVRQHKHSSPLLSKVPSTSPEEKPAYDRWCICIRAPFLPMCRNQLAMSPRAQ